MEWDFVRTGRGPRLLLLHSGFHTWVEFRRLIQLLSTDHDVLATTQPGSVGGPPLDTRRSLLTQHADHVESVLGDLGWDDGVMAVGSSFGGVLAIELLARERVTRTVGLAPPWVAGAGLAYFGALFSAALPLVRMSRPLWPWSTQSGTVNGLWFHQSRRPVEVDAADAAALLDSVARFPFFRTGLGSGMRGPGMPDLATVDSSRVTLAWGGRDPYVPPWMRAKWSAALPNATVVDLPDFAHQPHLQDASTIAALIREAGRT